VRGDGFSIGLRFKKKGLKLGRPLEGISRTTKKEYIYETPRMDIPEEKNIENSKERRRTGKRDKALTTYPMRKNDGYQETARLGPVRAIGEKKENKTLSRKGLRIAKTSGSVEEDLEEGDSPNLLRPSN